jgi:hypothetical protein
VEGDIFLSRNDIRDETQTHKEEEEKNKSRKSGAHTSLEFLRINP